MTHTTYSNTKMILIGSVIALGALALATPASAYFGGHHGMSNDVNVGSENNAAVVNEVMVGANTGYNGIAGGNTGKAGNGGDARSNRADANGGKGGNSGASNNEGVIGTGDATAIGTVNNDINSNLTAVTKDCECDNRKSRGGDVTAWSANTAILANGLGVDANTGDNMIDGGTSGAAGNGGDATARSWSMWKTYMQKGGYGHHNKNNGGEANGGNGGNTGASNNSGATVTGTSIADGLLINVVNRNVTRIAR